MARAHDRFHLLPTAVTLLGLLMLSGPSARAQSLCSQPVTPICATGLPAATPTPATEKAVNRSRCVEDAGTYRERLEEYRQCLQGSIDQADRSLRAADAFIACLKQGAEECHLDGAR